MEARYHCLHEIAERKAADTAFDRMTGFNWNLPNGESFFPGISSIL